MTRTGIADSQIGAKDGYVFFVHVALRPSAELCFLVGSSSNLGMGGRAAKEIKGLTDLCSYGRARIERTSASVRRERLDCP